jgi:Holliday junction DNA helicase RuvB
MREDFLNNEKENMHQGDRDLEKVLRPQVFDDFAGQDKIIENLLVFIKAAKMRGEALDHCLLSPMKWA